MTATKTLNIRGTLLELKEPLVMGILNITPDSFYSGSRKQTEKEITERIETILAEGGRMIDLGGYSSRPDAKEVSPDEEMNRLSLALDIILRHYPDVITSVDTFRAGIARACVEKYGVAIINDISGGELDPEMFSTAADLQVPYILMHMRGTPQTMQQKVDYADFMGEVMLYFSEKIRQLNELGVNDVILDPGFGFGKTLEQNYELLARLEEFADFQLPLLVGMSRKSMVGQLLDRPVEARLAGSLALALYASTRGARIIRVHDVQETVDALRIFSYADQFRTQR